QLEGTPPFQVGDDGTEVQQDSETEQRDAYECPQPHRPRAEPVPKKKQHACEAHNGGIYGQRQLPLYPCLGSVRDADVHCFHNGLPAPRSSLIGSPSFFVRSAVDGAARDRRYKRCGLLQVLPQAPGGSSHATTWWLPDGSSYNWNCRNCPRTEWDPRRYW